MNQKRVQLRTVHKFTDKTCMRFRPTHLSTTQQSLPSEPGFTGKMKSMLSSIWGGASSSATISQQSKNKSYSNTANSQKSIKFQNKTSSEISKGEPEEEKHAKKSQMKVIRSESIKKYKEGSVLMFLQKINSDTFLIGNENQVDMITISGIMGDYVETDFNWSLNLKTRIYRISVDIKKSFLAIQCDHQIHLYKFQNKKPKVIPKQISRIKMLGEVKFMLFLKDSFLGVFYDKNATIYSIEDNHAIRLSFNKKYEGIKETFILFQIPKPMENTLNIFFKQYSNKTKTFALWRLELDFKNNVVQYRGLQKIYDILNDLENSIKIESYSKQIFMMNFKYEIIAAKDGYIIDSANTNIQEEKSFLIYLGDHLLHVSQSKIEMYTFNIETNVKPYKIKIQSLDSAFLEVPKNYMFLNCLEMLNDNYVAFYQIEPDYNRKTKGEIDYILLVTQKLTVQEKLNQIFAFESANELAELSLAQNFHKIEEKCDIAFKIGLSRKQVFLQLWNKSNKSSIQDFKFLLDTLDYDTIKQEIQKKLRKASIPFNEVYKIQQSCFQMLAQDLVSPINCTQKIVKNYLCSHFLLRKLALYRNMHFLNKAEQFKEEKITGKPQSRRQSEKQEEKKQVKIIQKQNIEILKLDIQSYTRCQKMELKSDLLDYVFRFCHEQKDTSKQIRTFIRDFKFPLRIIYKQLLLELIMISKEKLIDVLQLVPEFLPFAYQEKEDESQHEGVWGKKQLNYQITSDEWANNLHLAAVTTIYNKEIVNELIKTVWFKRNLFTSQDLIALSKQEIIENHEFNTSDHIFYYFISKLFELQKNKSYLAQIIEFIQSRYSLPSHLKGKVFLYQHLFQYFQREKYQKPDLDQFSNFLRLKDYEIFKLLFEYEKIKKGCLLKEAKKIYCDLGLGNEAYNEGLDNYFKSNLSNISDLKYILNRLNNEKQEYHAENQSIYEVLVKGMQMKIKLGSANDIPIDEVIIYIENILLAKDNKIFERLKIVQRINQEQERFKDMKINMSILEIMQNCDKVITAMVNYEINKRKVLEIRDQEEMIDVTYTILAEIQTVQEQIYQTQESDLSFFVYVTKLMENIDLIKYAAILLQDQYLFNTYSVDDRTIQNIVLFMHKWKFSQELLYVKNEPYMRQLLKLLPEESSWRIVIQCELDLALLLNTNQFPIEYPLSIETNYSIQTIQQRICHLPCASLMKLDLEMIHEKISIIQKMQVQNFFLVENSGIKLSEIYELVIARLIELLELKEAIPLIRKVISLAQNSQQNKLYVVYIIIIFNEILPEFAEAERHKATKMMMHFFNDSFKMLEIIEYFLKKSLSTSEEIQFIDRELKEGQHFSRCFDQNNIIFDQEFIGAKSETIVKLFQQLIYTTGQHLITNRQDFMRSTEFMMIYVMLAQNPYALAKYIYIRRNQINLKLLKSYLSYVIKELIFDGLNVLLVSRRIFCMVLDAIQSRTSIDLVIRDYEGTDFENDEALIEFSQDQTLFETKLKKSINAFQNKILSLISLRKDPRYKEYVEEKKKKIEVLLTDQNKTLEKQPSIYPFADSEDQYEDQKNDILEEKDKKLETKRSGPITFDPEKQRALVMSRNDQDHHYGLYLSTNYECQNLNDVRKTTNTANLYKSKNKMKNNFSSLSLPNKNLGISKRIDGNAKQNAKLKYADRIDRAESLIKFEGMSDPDEEEINEALTIKIKKFGSYKLHQEDLIGDHSPSRGSNLAVSEDLSMKKSSDYSEPEAEGEKIEKVAQNPLFGFLAQIPSQNEEEKDSFMTGFVGEALTNLVDYVFKINVKEIDENAYTPVNVVRKALLQDCGETKKQANLDFSILLNEQNRENQESFKQYLRRVIESIYSCDEKPLSLLLYAIQQLSAFYPIVEVSKQILDIYIRFEEYHCKYNLVVPMQKLFPAEGLFLKFTDVKSVFKYFLPYILVHIDENNILMISKMIHLAFKNSVVLEEFFVGYLCIAIAKYDKDAETEIEMQKQKLLGLMQRLQNVEILFEKSAQLLGHVSSESRRVEIIQMIKLTLMKKKKEKLADGLEVKLGRIRL